jgi:hypothetical protein
MKIRVLQRLRYPLSNVWEAITLCTREEIIFVVMPRHDEKYESANDEMHI